MKVGFKRAAIAVGVVLQLTILAAGYWLVWGDGRSLYLPCASVVAVELGALGTAESYAEEMLLSARENPNDWDYGNKIHDANIIYGRVALAKGNVAEAKRRLLEAGKTPGSPQLNSFGPNRTLARELLEKGEKAVVIEYLDLCKKFWGLGGERIDAWKTEIENGEIPDL